MADISAFADGCFDLIFNSPSTLFVPDLEPVWCECYRLLRAGGVLMTGFMNPDEFIFDDVALTKRVILSLNTPYPVSNTKC